MHSHYEGYAQFAAEKHSGVAAGQGGMSVNELEGLVMMQFPYSCQQTRIQKRSRARQAHASWHAEKALHRSWMSMAMC
jgi:hypothetical protein